jgi:hypothetical protein
MMMARTSSEEITTEVSEGRVIHSRPDEFFVSQEGRASARPLRLILNSASAVEVEFSKSSRRLLNSELE